MIRDTVTCDTLDALLEDYLEETLDAGRREAVERHAGGCARCGGLVADLTDIRTRAAALPTLRPSRDLWEGIAARIDPPVIEIRKGRDAGRAGALWAGRDAGRRRRPIWLGAAAAALVVVSAGVSHLLTRQAMQAKQTTAVASAPAALAPTAPDSLVTVPSGPQVAMAPAAPKVERPAVRREASSPATSPASRVPRPASLQLAARAAGDVVYDREIAVLRRALRERKAQLDPATVAVLEESLGIIDQAIAQSRAALARDPASAFLNQQLTSALEKKLELLRTAAALPAGRT